jgi:hypothetical protein
MASNNISLEALKSHLFETLEGVKNLSDDQASPCERVSIEQAKQIVDIADSIIDIYKTQVDALKVFSQMDNVASVGQLSVGMGIISQEENKMIGG